MREEVAKIMSKYDLEAIPVVNEQKQLVGRITIDDIVDLIKDEAEKDYQLAAGISSDVEADDSIFQHTKARLPWLILGLVGGLGSVFILEGFEGFMNHPSHKALFFLPLSLLQWLGTWVFNHQQLLYKDLPMMWSKEVCSIVCSRKLDWG